jgi:hypothetical protein
LRPLQVSTSSVHPCVPSKTALSNNTRLNMRVKISHYKGAFYIASAIAIQEHVTQNRIQEVLTIQSVT